MVLWLLASVSVSVAFGWNSQRTGGLELCSFPDEFGCRDLFFFSNLKYLMFPLDEYFFVGATLELQIWCLSDRFLISRRAQFRFQSGVNCSPPEIVHLQSNYYYSEIGSVQRILRLFGELVQIVYGFYYPIDKALLLMVASETCLVFLHLAEFL